MLNAEEKNRIRLAKQRRFSKCYKTDARLKKRIPCDDSLCKKIKDTCLKLELPILNLETKFNYCPCNIYVVSGIIAALWNLEKGEII